MNAAKCVLACLKMKLPPSRLIPSRSVRHACIFALGVMTNLWAARGYKLTVAAGDIAREQSVVTFKLPAEGKDWRLRDRSGVEVPLQVGAEREGAFVVRRMAAGEKDDYRLESSASVDRPALVQLMRTSGKIEARASGRMVFSFQEEKSVPPDAKIPDYYSRGGYIHPVLSPAGAIVTGDFRPDHYHHHGIWFAWVKTEYEGRHPDFWNVQDKLGRLDFKGVERIWSGPVHGGIVARIHSIDTLAPTPKAVVDERWEIRVYPAGEGRRPYWMFDLVSTQKLVGNSPLKLPTYRYGGIGIRGNAQWDGEGDKTRFLTSSGESDRIKAHETRAAWCHMGGLVEGKFTGIATLGHPANFRAPEPLRVNPKVPFLNFAPSQAGDWEMVPGQTYVWRYRFIVHDGEPEKAWLDARWADYAQPMQVTVAIAP